MTKTIKSILALALTVAMILSFATIGVSAYTTDTNGFIEYALNVGDVQAAGTDTTVTLPISLDEGLGLTSTSLKILYDSQYLTPSSVSAPNGFSGSFGDVSVKGTINELGVVVYNSQGDPIKDSNPDINICSITFNIKSAPPVGTKAFFRVEALKSDLSAVIPANVNDPTVYPTPITYKTIKDGSITFGTPSTDEITADGVVTSSVPYNTAASSLNIPGTVAFATASGTKNATVMWNTAAYNPKTIGKQTFNGTIMTLFDAANTANHVAKAEVTVNKATVKSATASSSTVSVPFNTALNAVTGLPTQASVSINESADTFNIALGAWTSASYDSLNITDEQTVTAALNTDATVDTTGQTVTAKVKVSQGVAPAGFLDTAKQDPAFAAALTKTNVEKGTALQDIGLPASVPVVMAGAQSYTAQLPITWDVAGYDAVKGTTGVKTVNGTIGASADGKVAAPTGTAANITASVTLVDEVKTLTITAGSADVFTGDIFTIPVTIKNSDLISGGVRGLSLSVNTGANGHETLVGVKGANDTAFTPVGVDGTALTPSGIQFNVTAGGVINVAWAGQQSEVYNSANELEMFELQFKAKENYNDMHAGSTIGFSNMAFAGSDGQPVYIGKSVYGIVQILPLQVAYIDDDVWNPAAPSAQELVEDTMTAPNLKTLLTTKYPQVSAELGALTDSEARMITQASQTSIKATDKYRKNMNFDITWDTSTFDPNLKNVPQKIYGTIDGGLVYGGVGYATAAQLKVEMTVKVASLEVTSVDGSPFDAALLPGEKTVEADAIAAALPAKVTLNLSDGSVINNVPVVWTRNAADLAASGAYNGNADDATYLYDGALNLTGLVGIKNTANIKAVGTITVTDKHVLSEVRDILRYLTGITVDRINTNPAYAAKLDVNGVPGIDIGDAVKILDIIKGYDTVQ